MELKWNHNTSHIEGTSQGVSEDGSVVAIIKIGTAVNWFVVVSHGNLFSDTHELYTKSDAMKWAQDVADVLVGTQITIDKITATLTNEME